LRADPADPSGTKLIGDLAQSWTVAGEGLTDAIKLRQGVKVHDGSDMSSRDVKASYIEPDLDLYKFQSTPVSPANYAGYTDTVLDDLYQKQSRAIDPEERKTQIRAFERRLLDEESHYLYTLQWHQMIRHLVRARGWTITPSHYLNNQLDTVWLAE